MLNQIVGIVNEIRKEYPVIGNELDGKIYYMNGNDGTDFDWNANDHTSEFYMYHENEIGFIKLYVNNDDTYTAYVYPNGEMRAVKTIKGDLEDGDSLYLAALLYRKADREYIYDAIIEEIDFAYEPREWELKEMNGYYIEDEDWGDK